MTPPAQTGTPSAEVQIDESLVRALLQTQHPELAALDITPVDSGWDNAVFRLGPKLAVRIPRRAVSADLLRHEQTWLPSLAKQVPIPIPAPVCVGVPGCGYPWFWSIVPWIEGESADGAVLKVDQAVRLAGFLRALHVKAPDEAPFNPVRGVPLQDRAASVEERFKRLAERNILIASSIRATWESALQAKKDACPTWIHGDLHPRNVLIQDGKITGIIDWGDINSGDRATDLAAVWMLFSDRIARHKALIDYGADDDTVLRAKGWAVLFAVLLLDTGLSDHPRHAAVGDATLRQLQDDYA
jgi:aminoglycoside phosphotransferase (APT) family kinase protein